jgi:hypothetical protein
MGGTRGAFIMSVMVTLGPVCMTAWAVERTSPYGKGVVKLILTQWLADRLKDPNLLIVRTQGDVYDYFTQRVPGEVDFNDQSLRAPSPGEPQQRESGTSVPSSCDGCLQQLAAGSYSHLSAAIGSSLAARRAGIQAASRAVPMRTTIAAPNVAGS